MVRLSDITHFVFGLIGAISSELIAFAVVFSTYQAIDALKYDESKKEFCGDFAEFAIGAVIGLCLKSIALL